MLRFFRKRGVEIGQAIKCLYNVLLVIVSTIALNKLHKIPRWLFQKQQIQENVEIDFTIGKGFVKICLILLIKTLFLFLKRLAMKPKEFFEIDSMINVENIDHVAIEIKIKYFVSLIKNNFQLNIAETQGEQMINQLLQKQNKNDKSLYQIVSIMYKQTIQRTQYYKSIWDKSKQCYLKSFSSVMYLNQVLTNNQIVIRKNIKNNFLDQFINKIKISVCLTSKSTREKDINSKNIMKEIPEDQREKIWLENQKNCVHSRFNLEFVNTLTGQVEKGNKKDSNCNNIMKFADVLCSLPEVKNVNSSLKNFQDAGIKQVQVFSDFIKYCAELIYKYQERSRSVFSQEKNWLEDILEQKLSKKIYDRLFPRDPTYDDVAFYFRLKTLDFITYFHLKIKKCLRFDKMWQLAGRQLRMIDKVKTASQKLNCINQFSKNITDYYYIINQNDEPATAQDIYPFIIYVFIKAAPKRMISNMKQQFLLLLKVLSKVSHQNKLMQKQGYAYTQLKSAIQFLDTLNEQKLQYQGISTAQKTIDFRKTIYDKQIEYGIYFLLLRKNTSHEVEYKNIQFLKNFFTGIGNAGLLVKGSF